LRAEPGVIPVCIGRDRRQSSGDHQLDAFGWTDSANRERDAPTEKATVAIGDPAEPGPAVAFFTRRRTLDEDRHFDERSPDDGGHLWRHS